MLSALHHCARMLAGLPLPLCSPGTPLSRSPHGPQLAFVGLSVVATVRQALKLGNERAAQRVRSEFRLSDKRFWGIKARSPPFLSRTACRGGASHDSRLHPDWLTSSMKIISGESASLLQLAGTILRYLLKAWGPATRLSNCS